MINPIDEVKSGINSDKTKGKGNLTSVSNALKIAIEKTKNEELKNYLLKLLENVTNSVNLNEKVDIIIKDTSQQPTAPVSADSGPRARVIPPNLEWGAGAKEIVEGFINNFSSERKKFDMNKIQNALNLINVKESHSIFAKVNENYGLILRKHQNIGTAGFSRSDIGYILEKMEIISDSLQKSNNVMNGLLGQLSKKPEKEISKGDKQKVKETIAQVGKHFNALKNIVDTYHKKLIKILV